MRIVEYVDALNTTVEFQDKYKTRMKIRYNDFVKGNVKNPYYPTVCDVGMIGAKYPATINGVITKEYNTWKHMLDRCYDKKIKAFIFFDCNIHNKLQKLLRLLFL